MRSIVSIPIFLVAVACSRQENVGLDTLKSQIANYYSGIRDHDRTKMIDATTTDFLLFEQGKVWNNDSVFHEMDSYPYQATFFFDDFQATGNHLSYRVQADFTFDDSVKVRYNFLESAAFVKIDGKWKIKFLHVTMANSIRFDTIQYAREYYDERVAHFASEPMTRGGTIFLGNSIMEYSGWKLNRGIGGDNTFGVLRRLDDVIKRQPEKLVIEIGINDISQDIPSDIIVENIEKIIDRIRNESPQTKIYFISILPTNDNVKNEYPDAFNKNHIVDDVNGRLQFRASQGDFTFVDLNSKVRDENNKLNVRYAAADGLHLNKDGYQLLEEILKKNGFILI